MRQSRKQKAIMASIRARSKLTNLRTTGRVLKIFAKHPIRSEKLALEYVPIIIKNKASLKKKSDYAFIRYSAKKGYLVDFKNNTVRKI
jgi:hypothetical protein